jgi:hypothetical protein
MFSDADFPWIVRWIRADAVGILVAALWAMTVTHGSWAWFFGLFLVPDVSMAGYLFGSRAGAVAYNTGHMFAWPLAMLGIGLASHSWFTSTAALSWIAHIAFDHALGYGLKLPTTFEHTSLGSIGRSRRRQQAADGAFGAGSG